MIIQDLTIASQRNKLLGLPFGENLDAKFLISLQWKLHFVDRKLLNMSPIEKIKKFHKVS